MSIQVKELTKIYRLEKAVDNISFEAHQGEVVGFLGPNGAGKSTTMKIATGYIPPSKGTVLVNGIDVVSKPLEVQRQIGYLPEHNPLYLDMYVKDYLAFSGSFYKLKGRLLRQRVAEMVELTGLTINQNKKIGQLSKGYRQRVGLAQALIHDPKVLILDEPTTGLDPNQIQEIRGVIRNISQDKTVIFSTHIMQEVQALCDRAIIINKGKIVADDKVGVLQKGKQEETRIKVTFTHPIDDSAFEKIENSRWEKHENNTYIFLCQNDKEVRQQLLEVTMQHQWDLVGLNVELASLENVFQQVTKK